MTTKPLRCSFPRYLDGKSVKFSTVPVALLALEAAHRFKRAFKLNNHDAFFRYKIPQYLKQMTSAFPSYHLLGFERHAANFLLANLQPSSVLKVAYCLLSVLNWWSLLFLAIINDVIY